MVARNSSAKSKEKSDKEILESVTEKKRIKCLRYSFTVIRWAFILGCLAFVLYGWVQSAEKYFAKQTSVSILKNESKTFFFPSISFCPHFKNGAHIVEDIIKPAMMAKNLTRFDQLNFQELIAPWRWKRTEFMKIFSHYPGGGAYEGAPVLFNDSYWVESIPHPQYTGQCFTYTPPFQSWPGLWNGLRMGMQFPNSSTLDEKAKQKLLANVAIFFHDNGPLYFYREDDRPSHKMLGLSHIRYMRENRVELRYSRYTALSTDSRPCSDDPKHDFRKCVETRYSKLRGCQPPWYYFDDVDIPVCNDLDQIVKYFTKNSTLGAQYFSLPDMSTTQMADFNGCPVPCTTTDWNIFEVTYDNIISWMTPIDNGSEWIIVVWFKNFFFEFSKEYVICDYTCLLGEIGGNLGFFLGGSVIEYFDGILELLNLQVFRFPFGSST